MTETKVSKEDANAFAELLKAMDERAQNTEYDLKFPLTINGIKLLGKWGLGDGWRHEQGEMVAIRPVAKEYDKKTFLGIYLGDITVEPIWVLNKKTNEIEVFSRGNPAIFVPDLNKVVFGYESWWGPIKNEDQLRQITDDDIQNIWYVKALKQLEAKEVQDG